MPKIKPQELLFSDIREDVKYQSLVNKGVKLSYEYDFSAKDIYDYFKMLEDLGYFKFSFDSREDYGSSITILSAHRMETIEEAKERMEKKKAQDEKTKQSEYELFKRLQQKYGNVNP